MKRSWLVGVLMLAVVALGVALSGCGPKIYNNGTYKGIGQADAHGYAVAEVTVDKDKITAVNLSEVTELAVDKDYNTYPYPKAKEANTEMAKKFVGKSDANVDTVAQATSSSKKYIEAVSFALEKAKKTPAVKTTYFDGTFLGKSKADDKGYGIAFVTVKSDKVTAVQLNDVVLPAGTLKDWATYPYAKALEAKGTMEKAFVDKNGAAGVDTVAGATGSSTKWIEAVTNALANAKVK